MADPLSIAASIAGVISLADIVFLRTKKYLSSAKSADKEVHELSQEVLLLGGALHSLSRLAQALDTNGLKDQHVDDLRMHHIAACHATLDEIAKKLKKLEGSSTKRKLVWPFASDRTKALIDEVSRHKESVNLALTADSMGTLLRVLSKSEEIYRNMDEVLQEAKKTRAIITRIQQDSAREEILDYFLPYNPQQNYEMSLSLRHPRTGLWLTRRPEFQTWLAHPDSALWLSGIPGAGKTVLAGTIIEEALKRSTEDVATAFFFCDYKNGNTQTTDNVLSALASQLAIQKEESYAHLERYYQELHPQRALERRPDVSGLQRILKDMVKSFDHVYLIVDGLDECGDNTNNVIDDILDILGCSDNISTAFLSRDEDNIRDRLEEDFSGVEIAAHTEDITEYVTSEIEKRIGNKSLRIDDLSLKDEILERLVEGAKGMFRWVACQLDALCDCLSDKECRDALNRLPPGLNESYLRILQRVPKGKERLMQMMLNFIAYARPSLEISLLREALSVPEKIGRHGELSSLSIIREDSITRLCRSLVRKSNDACYYEFAHFSVLEYLEGEMKSVPEMDNFRVSQSICEYLLAKQCLNYLLSRDFSSLPTDEEELLDHICTRDEQHPLYLYAAAYWPLFARDHWTDQGLLKSAAILFQPTKSANFTSWALELISSAVHNNTPHIPSYRPDGRRVGLYHQRILRLLPQLVDRNFTTLHMAAALSLPVICSSLLDKGASINRRSCFGTPLQCALQGMFLETSVDCVPRGAEGLYGHPYYRRRETDSSHFGKEITVRLLLKAGATHLSACSSPFEGQTLMTVALKVASRIHDLGAMTALLEAGLDVQEDDLNQIPNFESSLHTRDDGLDTFRLEKLITCLGPMIDKSAGHFRLCQAAWSRAIELGCEFTKDWSVIDTRISLSQDALIKPIFTSLGRFDIEMLTRALEDPRVDIVGLTDVDNNSVLQIPLRKFRSAPSECMAMMKVILAAGAEVKQPNDKGLLPIHELASCFLRYDGVSGDDGCYEVLCEVVSEFVRKGTGCNVRSRTNRNVFHFGVGSPSFVRAVLETETGKNILHALKTRDEDGYTPISLALREGKEETALLLLRASDCDPEALRSPTSVHALCVAAGEHRAFKLILDARVGLDIAGAMNATIWRHIGPRTGKEVVLQLIHMVPGGFRCCVDGKLPLDIYLESCIAFGRHALDSDVVQLLTISGSEGLNQQEKKSVWEKVVRSITRRSATRRSATRRSATRRSATRQSTANPGSNDRNRFFESPRGDEITEQVITNLSQLGFIQSYEEATHVPGILPLLKLLGPLGDHLQNLWPVSSESLFDLLEQAISWESLRESVPILRLLKTSVKSQHVELVDLMLENGVSVHQRIDEMSALEVACLEPTDGPNAKRIFKILLDYAEGSRLDEINPNQGQRRGLVHYLSGPGKQWQIKELAKRGMDLNNRTSFHFEAQPAIVQHLFEGSPDSALTLLEMGANPAMADSRGMDAALAAALHSNIAFLLHLLTIQGEDWELNWRRTFTANFLGAKGVQLYVHEANALHLAAWSGDCDVLRFYLDRDLLKDLDSVSADGFTPMHLAAANGQASVIELLHCRGANLNLKTANGTLPLHLAVQNEQTEVIKFLVEHGSFVDDDMYGMSPVAYAAHLQNESILDCFFTSHQVLADQSQAWRRQKDLSLAYEQALIRGNIKQCEVIRRQGCPINVDLPHQNGRSALVLAIEQSDKELIRWLLTYGAKAMGKTFGTNMARTSALQVMIARRALNDVLPLLLRKYQSEGGLATAERPSLIHIAIENDNNLGLEILLGHIARYEALDSLGNFGVAKLLLKNGADVNVLNNKHMTPLQVAILSEVPNRIPTTRLLLRYDAALESRSNRGLEAHQKNSFGSSATQCAMFRHELSTFLLNHTSIIGEIGKLIYSAHGTMMDRLPACLSQHFNLYLRRLGLERLRALANLEPTYSWSPLCMSASIGLTLAVINIIQLGADVDFEGSPYGSALMAACSSGHLESVKILVRHGAAISYLGADGIRSAVHYAKEHKAIMAWLLVKRFTDQKKLSSQAEAGPSAHPVGEVQPWSRITKAELVITGIARRQVHESARDYIIRLVAVKKEWRGKVVPQHTMTETHHPA
ncbi:hypothetical protein N8I77_003090 [Diaporthe amygdali]|uniref:NACHT domain-containing protein n=1 Tax=Phomopsis amygdali TaxID=1214568 RepID=A0AAD9W4J9_PHOAM|nr:hypothetical protein N8I77_003090 [Diaporthe amygdali]